MKLRKTSRKSQIFYDITERIISVSKKFGFEYKKGSSENYPMSETFMSR